MKRNPRPRKYESAAARQAAYKARAEMLEFRAEPKTAETLTSIAQELDVSRSELLLSMVKFALTNHDWARFGLTHKTLPYYQGNPIMATKKASPAQLAARKKFAEMARSGAFKKTKVTRIKKNPTIQYIVYSELTPGKYKQMLVTENKQRAISVADVNQMDNYHSVVEDQVGHLIYDAKNRKNYLQSNPSKRKKTVSQKISQLVHEGYPQKQAVAVALSEKRAGKVKGNPLPAVSETILQQLGGNKFIAMTGASRISGDSTHLSFKVPRNTSKANAVGIYYDRGSDTYTMKFWKQKGAPTFEMVLVEQFDGVYADMLRTLFTDVTGLETSLGTMGRRSNPVKSGKKTTSTNPSKRSSTRSAVVPNPRAKKPAKLSYVCIAPIEYSGSKYGIDERTPVTLKFSPREMKLAYKCYKLPAAIVQSKEFQEFANDHIVIYMSIAELKTMLRKFIK